MGWVVPQPGKPTNPAEDYKKDDSLQYRNRNIKYKHERGAPHPQVKASDPADADPLYFATSKADPTGSDVKQVAAKEGWYVDITKILEANNLYRIPHHKNWVTHAKSWEWWHYQYKPPSPPGASGDPTFGEYLQIFGVHEYRLRQVRNGWSTHEDIEHEIG
jgi:hypothetical protein